MATRNFVPRANNEGGIGTSVKQWASGFFQKLAVGAITTAVTVLTPSDDANNQQPATTGWVRSQFQSILKTVLTAAGLKYNIATNGYICFGSLFGGLILQWGIVVGNATVILPISFKSWSSRITLALAESNDDGSSETIVVDNGSYNVNSFKLIPFSSGTKNRKIHWLVIGS